MIGVAPVAGRPRLFLVELFAGFPRRFSCLTPIDFAMIYRLT
jgi:hypothetical protein